ncbi:hypothetical protein LPJ53_004747 [Coemansia erecta]|uniref:MFS general substrate transporter n=1 Tax=Coemansia erecta TaxID=147472 RepID=A0A9W8CPH1_9FUNG|nr:hypothetical protein LPJ53_004747 [Coemansia erecta]
MASVHKLPDGAAVDAPSSSSSSSQPLSLTEHTPLLPPSAHDRLPPNSIKRTASGSRSPPLLRGSSLATERKPLTALQMLSMTVLLAGIQFVWTVELGYGTPYLLSLGLSKPLMTLVWMAGPLSGLLIQPVVGRLSDRCRARIGRRRPFIIGGAAFVVGSVITIAYAREMAVGLAHIMGMSETAGGGGSEGTVPDTAYNEFVTRASIALAVIGFYVLDFSINTSQACARALALDIPPLEQQDLANAYAGRMLNLGSVTGYMVGFLDLRALVPWKTSSQMQALCLIAVIVFVLTITWTCVSVREEPLRAHEADETPVQSSSEWLDMARAIWRGIVSLPKPVQRVCNVQFFAWVAWFPFLFFATTWVTEIMARTGNPLDPDFIERATRAGSFALFLYSVASLGFSLLLPLVVSEESSARWKVSLRAMWRISLATMGLLLLMTYVVEDVHGATVLIVAMAFPWALAMWAPFAMVGEYVAIASEVTPGSCENDVDIDDETDEEYITGAVVSSALPTSPRIAVSGSSRLAAVAAADARGDSIGSTVRAFDEEEDRATVRSSLFAHTDTTRTLHENEVHRPMDSRTDEDRLEGGAILGIHNMYVVLPQFVINAVSSLVFAWLGSSVPSSGHHDGVRTVEFLAIEKVTSMVFGEGANEAVGFVLRIGGCSALVAAAMTVFLFDRQGMRVFVQGA